MDMMELPLTSPKHFLEKTIIHFHLVLRTESRKQKVTIIWRLSNWTNKQMKFAAFPDSSVASDYTAETKFPERTVHPELS